MECVYMCVRMMVFLHLILRWAMYNLLGIESLTFILTHIVLMLIYPFIDLRNALICEKISIILNYIHFMKINIWLFNYLGEKVKLKYFTRSFHT
jgi:hypothetical protein